MDPGAECKNGKFSLTNQTPGLPTAASLWKNVSCRYPLHTRKTQAMPTKGLAENDVVFSYDHGMLWSFSEKSESVLGPRNHLPLTISLFLYMSFPFCPRPGSDFFRVKSKCWCESVVQNFPSQTIPDVHGLYQKRKWRSWAYKSAK